MAEALSKAANSGLSAQIWSSYKTAKKTYILIDVKKKLKSL
jgi:hypothetical protein